MKLEMTKSQALSVRKCMQCGLRVLWTEYRKIMLLPWSDTVRALSPVWRSEIRDMIKVIRQLKRMGF